MKHQPLVMQYKQQANPLLSIDNYTPLAISWNDKNKQRTLLRQRKLAFTAREKYTFCVIKLLETTNKYKKCPRPLIRPNTNY